MRGKRHLGRVTGLVAIGAISALALGACAGGGEPTASSQPTLSSDPVTITFAWWGNDDRAARTQKAIDAFEAKYPNITVEPQSTDFASYFDKLATETAGGAAPDVMQMQDAYLRTYGSNGSLLDLNSVNSILDTSDIPQAALDTGVVDGSLYAVVVAVAAEAMFVNETILDKSGVTLPDDSKWTWDDFAKIAKKISDAGNGEYYGVDSTRVMAPARLEGWARQLGDMTFDADGKLVIKEKTLASYFQYYLDLQKSGAGQPAAQTIENWNAGQTAYPMMTGTAAFTPIAYNWMSMLTKSTGEPMKMLQLPTFKGQKPASFNKAAMYWSISSKSEHPAEAALLVNFLTNDPDAALALGTERGLPADTAALDALQPTLTDNDLAQIDYANSIAGILGQPYQIPPPSTTTIDALLQEYVEKVLFEQQTPKEAAAGFITDMNAAIEEAK